MDYTVDETLKCLNAYGRSDQSVRAVILLPVTGRDNLINRIAESKSEKARMNPFCSCCLGGVLKATNHK